MKRIRIVLPIAIALCILMSAVVQAGNIVVIVNPASAISKATASEISKLFMGKSTAVNKEKVVPVDQAAETQARIDFCDKILGRTVKKVLDYWKKRVFSGKGNPPGMLSDDKKVIAHVAETPNAIGYISAGALNDKVKAVSVDGKVEW